MIETLLRARKLVADRAYSVLKAARRFRQGKIDPADCLLAQIATDAGCAHTLTFDRDAARHTGMRVVE